MARVMDPDLRREWRQRVVDHDGEQPGDGGDRALAEADRWAWAWIAIT